MLKKTILLIILPLCLTNPVHVTFTNVTFRGYSFFMEKFNKTIPSSNNLTEFLPKLMFDKVEFKEQHIPVLYENSLADLEYLDELVIESCQVDEIRPGALRNVPLLKTFSLKGNKLEEIKRGVFNNLPLSRLDLSRNSITIIDGGALDDLPYLVTINFSENLIAQWDPEWFKNAPLLSTIWMDSNSIEKLPNGVFKNLAHNTFNKADLGLTVFLGNNKIKAIEPYAFQNSPKINSLMLDNNELDGFDENLLNNVEVNVLSLIKNNIRCLDGDLAKIFKAETTHIDANPFDCECLEKVKWWAEKYEYKKNIQLSFLEINCAAQEFKTKATDSKKVLDGFKGEDE